MPRRQRLPSYRLHKPSGQAVVTIRGKDHYLGKFDCPESHQRFRQLVAESLTIGMVEVRRRQVADAGPTVDELIAAFWRALEQSGRYRKDGKPTSEMEWLIYSFRPLSEVFGSTPARDFGPKRLQELRTWIVTHRPEGARPLARSTVNGRVRRIVHLFRWATSMELVPPAVWQGLRALPGLRRGETTRVREAPRVKPVAWDSVEPVLLHLSPTVAAMVRLQWLTGMRPGEVRGMRMAELDRSGDVWVYRPRHHKTEHHDDRCERYIGPRGQQVVLPFLKGDPQALLFSPEASEIERNLLRRASRKAPLWPSHEARFRPEPTGSAGAQYSAHTYRRAIERACRRAAVQPWSPNQLRHSGATRIRERYGIEAARAFLGHTTTDTTEIYAERDRGTVLRIVMEVG